MSPAEAQKLGVPTLHHLTVSSLAGRPRHECRSSSSSSLKLQIQLQLTSLAALLLAAPSSQRIIWLLEELGIDYHLVIHARTPDYRRAPPSLTAVHSLGKAPTLVTASGQAIVEAPAIAAYLLRTYDDGPAGGRFASPDAVRDETLAAFAGSSLGLWVSLAVLFAQLAKHTPWPAAYLARGAQAAMMRYLVMPELVKGMEFLVGELGDRAWFGGAGGGDPGREDFLLSFPFDNIAQWRWVDLERDYAPLAAWRARIAARPAWQRALEKAGGYDLVEMPAVSVVTAEVGEEEAQDGL